MKFLSEFLKNLTAVEKTEFRSDIGVTDTYLNSIRGIHMASAPTTQTPSTLDPLASNDDPFFVSVDSGALYGWNPNTNDWKDISATSIDLSDYVLKTDSDLTGYSWFVNDPALSGNSGTKAVSEAAVKSYVDTMVTSGVNFKGSYDTATNTPDLDVSPSGLVKGEMYVATSAGQFFTEELEVGDVIICNVDDPTTLADWVTIQRNLDAPSILAALISNPDTNILTDAEKAAIAANSLKVSNAAHTGDATGDAALTLQPAAITGKNSKGAPVGADEVLISDSEDSGNLKRATISSITSSSVGSTNLSYNSLTREVESDTGSNATLPEAVASGDSGLLSGADKQKIDDLAVTFQPVNDQSAIDALTPDKDVVAWKKDTNELFAAEQSFTNPDSWTAEDSDDMSMLLSNPRLYTLSSDGQYLLVVVGNTVNEYSLSVTGDPLSTKTFVGSIDLNPLGVASFGVNCLRMIDGGSKIVAVSSISNFVRVADLNTPNKISDGLGTVSTWSLSSDGGYSAGFSAVVESLSVSPNGETVLACITNQSSPFQKQIVGFETTGSDLFAITSSSLVYQDPATNQGSFYDTEFLDDNTFIALSSAHVSSNTAWIFNISDGIANGQLLSVGDPVGNPLGANFVYYQGTYLPSLNRFYISSSSATFTKWYAYSGFVSSSYERVYGDLAYKDEADLNLGTAAFKNVGSSDGELVEISGGRLPFPLVSGKLSYDNKGDELFTISGGHSSITNGGSTIEKINPFTPSTQSWTGTPIPSGLTIWEVETSSDPVIGVNAAIGIRNNNSNTSSTGFFAGSISNTIGFDTATGSWHKQSSTAQPALLESDGSPYAGAANNRRLFLAFNSSNLGVWVGKLEGGQLLWYRDSSGESNPFTNTNPTQTMISGSDYYFGAGVATVSNSDVGEVVTIISHENYTFGSASDFGELAFKNEADLSLGTSSTYDVPTSGDASASEVVLGNDTRLVEGVKVIDLDSDASSEPLTSGALLSAESGSHFFKSRSPEPDTSNYSSVGDLGYTNGNGYDVAMTNDGSTVFITRFNEGSTITEYKLNVPYRLELGVSSITDHVLTLSGNNRYMVCSNDGSKLYIQQDTTSIIEVALTTPNTIAGGYSQVSSTNMMNYTGAFGFYGFDFNEDRTKLIVVGSTGSNVYEWTLTESGNPLSVASSKTIVLPSGSGMRDIGYLDDDTLIVVNDSRHLIQYDISDRDNAVKMGSTYTSSSSGPSTSGGANTVGMYVSRASGQVYLSNYSTAGLFAYDVMSSEYWAISEEEQVNTDLSYNASTRELASSTGNNVTLPEAVASGDSGLLSGADKQKIDELAVTFQPVNDQSAVDALTLDQDVVAWKKDTNELFAVSEVLANPDSWTAETSDDVSGVVAGADVYTLSQDGQYMFIVVDNTVHEYSLAEAGNPLSTKTFQDSVNLHPLGLGSFGVRCFRLIDGGNKVIIVSGIGVRIVDLNTTNKISDGFGTSSTWSLSSDGGYSAGFSETMESLDISPDGETVVACIRSQSSPWKQQVVGFKTTGGDLFSITSSSLIYQDSSGAAFSGQGFNDAMFIDNTKIIALSTAHVAGNTAWVFSISDGIANGELLAVGDPLGNPLGSTSGVSYQGTYLPNLERFYISATNSFTNWYAYSGVISSSYESVYGDLAYKDEGDLNLTEAQVEAAGALMDSELTDVAAVKAIDQGLATGDDVEFESVIVNGDLGVGTTTPDAKFEVEASGTGAHPTIELSNYVGNSSVIRSKRGITLSADYVNNSGDDGSSSIFFDTDGTQKAVITGSGNMGLGTGTPSAKLDISDSGDGAELLKLSTERPWVFMQTNSGAGSELNLRSESSDKKFVISSPNGTEVASFDVNDTPSSNRVILAGDGGNVGVGTDNPSEKLVILENGFGEIKFRPSASDGLGHMIRYGGSGTGANVLRFVTSGDAETMRISGGNVGIGTESPSGNLEIAGNINEQALNLVVGNNVSDAGSTINFYAAGRNEVGEAMAQIKAHLVGDNGGSGNVQKGQLSISTFGSEALRIDESGNVGLGTDDPSEELHIASTGPLIKIENTDLTQSWRFGCSGTSTFFVNDQTNSSFPFKVEAGAATDTLVVDSSSRVGIGTDEPYAGLQVKDDNGVIISSTQATGERTATIRLGSPYQADHDAYCAKITSTNNQTLDFKSDLRFYTSIGNNQNAEERLSILSNGNVGIGKDTPSEKLDVDGFVKGERFVCGDGSGSLALTINDGDGNSNITFNHIAGTPDQDGNAGRITCNVDALTDANIAFQVKSGVTAGSNVATEQQMSIHEGHVKFTPNNVEVGRIGSNGLGLGVASPQRKLHISDVMRLEPSSTPSSPSAGDIYFDSTTNKLRCHDGTSWNDLF